MSYDRAIKKYLTAERLRQKTKEELIRLLIPLIEKATKVNEYWLNKGRKRNITEDRCHELTAEIWCELRDLHRDYWEI